MKQFPPNSDPINKRPRCYSVWQNPDSVEFPLGSLSGSIPLDVYHESSSPSPIIRKSDQRLFNFMQVIQEGRETPLSETDVGSDIYSRTPDSLVITPTKPNNYRVPNAAFYQSFNKLATLDQLSTEESLLSNLYYNDQTSREIQPVDFGELSSKEYSPESVISQHNTPQRRYNSVILHEIEQYISPDKTQFSQMIDISLGDSFISDRNISPICSYSDKQSFASVQGEKVYDLFSSINVKSTQKTDDLCNALTEEKDLPYLGIM